MFYQGSILSGRIIAMGLVDGRLGSGGDLSGNHNECRTRAFSRTRLTRTLY